MKVIAIDPSSSCCGYAVMTGVKQLVDAGRLRPNRRADAANDRIRAMATDLQLLLAEHADAQVVIEDTSGKVGSFGRRRGMNGAGLAVYGKALGYLWRVTEESTGREPVLVPENDWTRGVRKEQRIRIVAADYPAYKIADDPGGDTADAIALGRWWLIEGKFLNSEGQ